MRSILILAFLLLPSVTFAQKPEDRKKQDTQLVSQQSNEIELLKKNIELSNSINAQSSASVSNMLGSINTSITIFGIFISIALVFAGYYFTNILTRVAEIEKNTQSKLIEIIQIDQKLRELQDNINNNIYKIYKDIKYQELNTLLSLLYDKPSLFKVFESSFMGIDIPNNYFNKFYSLKNEISQVTDPEALNPMQGILQKYLAFMFYKFPFEMVSTEDHNRVNLRYGGESRKKQIIEFILDTNNNIPTRITHIKEQIQSINPGDKYFEEFVSFLSKDDIQSLIIGPSPHSGKVPEHHLARNSFFEQLLKN